MAAKPRILHSSKDMMWSLVPLLVVCAVVAVVSGNCSVGLSGTASDDKTPAYDVVAGLRADARVMPFPIRLPATPAGWKPNSGTSEAIGNDRVSNVGYIASSGMYIQLSQTAAPEDALVNYLADDANVLGEGVTQLGGHRWVRYSTDKRESIWITDLGQMRIGLSGRGRNDDSTTLGAAVLAVPPLPVTR